MRYLSCLALLCSAACHDCTAAGLPEITGPIVLGGISVPAETLVAGRTSYNVYCRSCHGPLGDGKGPLGLHQKPPARDLRLGIIKFASVPSGSLPTDDDVARVIREGIRGTAMLPWDVPEDELRPVVQYIKLYSPRWRTERPGTPIEISTDPWPADSHAEAIHSGEMLYHTEARCASCHPSYLDAERIEAMAEAAGHDRLEWMRAAPREATITDSAYGPIRATNFSTGPLRAGDSLDDLYRAIAAGVGGTAMPTWKGSLPEADLWALAHYVRSLMRPR